MWKCDICGKDADITHDCEKGGNVSESASNDLLKHHSTPTCTETEDREDCPVINTHCEYYAYQYDRNGEVAICYCTHKDNPVDLEGNCQHSLCPIMPQEIK